MKLEFRQTVTCNHLTLARVCKTIDWQQPLPRCGEYVAGLDTLDGEQELPVRKLLHRVQNLNFPLAFWLIRAIIVRQSFPRPLDGVADIEGCDGHIH